MIILKGTFKKKGLRMVNYIYLAQDKVRWTQWWTSRVYKSQILWSHEWITFCRVFPSSLSNITKLGHLFDLLSYFMTGLPFCQTCFSHFCSALFFSEVCFVSKLEWRFDLACLIFTNCVMVLKIQFENVLCNTI